MMNRLIQESSCWDGAEKCDVNTQHHKLNEQLDTDAVVMINDD